MIGLNFRLTPILNRTCVSCLSHMHVAMHQSFGYIGKISVIVWVDIRRMKNSAPRLETCKKTVYCGTVQELASDGEKLNFPPFLEGTLSCTLLLRGPYFCLIQVLITAAFPLTPLKLTPNLKSDDRSRLCICRNICR